MNWALYFSNNMAQYMKIHLMIQILSIWKHNVKRGHVQERRCKFSV